MVSRPVSYMKDLYSLVNIVVSSADLLNLYLLTVLITIFQLRHSEKQTHPC